MNWRHRSICRDKNPELFLPVGIDGPTLAQTAETTTTCRRCRVVSERSDPAPESAQAARP